MYYNILKKDLKFELLDGTLVSFNLNDPTLKISDLYKIKNFDNIRIHHFNKIVFLKDLVTSMNTRQLERALENHEQT